MTLPSPKSSSSTGANILPNPGQSFPKESQVRGKLGSLLEMERLCRLCFRYYISYESTHFLFFLVATK